MNFHLGENKLGQEIYLTNNHCENIYSLQIEDVGITGRLENIFTNYPVIRIYGDSRVRNNGYYDFPSIEKLNEFLKQEFEIKLTEEFLNYRLSSMVMNKLTE